MLKKALFAITSLLFAGTCYAAAPTQLGQTGIGLQVGTFSAIQMKRTIDETSAWDVVLGTQNEQLVGAADYLWYMPDMTLFHPYIGMGAGIAYDTDTEESDETLAGVGRLPLGVSYYPENTPLNASLQLTPMFKTLGPTELAASLSLLYYFQ